MEDRPVKDGKSSLSILSRLHENRVVARILDKLEKQTIARRYLYDTQRNPKYAKFVTTLIILFCVAFFYFNVDQILTWPPPVYKDPEVFNLTTTNIMWDVHFGRSPSCRGIDCHLTGLYPKEKYTRRATLPIREFPLVGYQNGDIIFYRTSVDLTSFDLARHETLLFHSVYRIT